MADTVAERMSQASATAPMAPPKKGERYRCSLCGMEIQVTADCHCKNGEHVHFECCGQPLTRV